jgi:hypothetical protein
MMRFIGNSPRIVVGSVPDIRRPRSSLGIVPGNVISRRPDMRRIIIIDESDTEDLI